MQQNALKFLTSDIYILEVNPGIDQVVFVPFWCEWIKYQTSIPINFNQKC